MILNGARERATNGTYGRQIRTEQKQIGVPVRSPTRPVSPCPFNSAVTVHVTMPGLMKDVGASYGCHNSVWTGRRAVTPTKSVVLHLLVRVSLPLHDFWLTSRGGPHGEPGDRRIAMNRDEFTHCREMLIVRTREVLNDQNDLFTIFSILLYRVVLNGLKKKLPFLWKHSMQIIYENTHWRF